MKVPLIFMAVLIAVAAANLVIVPRAPEVRREMTAAVMHRSSGARFSAPNAAAAAPAPQASRAGVLVLPVAGVRAEQLVDTWGQARSEGRRHEGIDILAPEMTPVRAVADGRIVKFFESVRGGITIYEFDARERYVFYYAHLHGRAPGLAEGSPVRQGDVIGYVGMTGNAPVPHLHFEIQRLTDARHWWEAESLNPFPYLRDGRAPD